jgi:hypothetical protein
MKAFSAICLSIFFFALGVRAQHPDGFQIMERPDKHQVDILFGGQLLTAYCYYDSIRKPILFPVNTPDGITVTRGYPIDPRPGERTDHPHHTGIWLNYESVNGLDFWNNSTAIPVNKRDQYGTVVHQQVIASKADKNHAVLTIAALWNRPDHKTLLKEQTIFNFTVANGSFFIDRKTVLTATDTTVVFKDAKDGLMAIRVARELELPSKEATSFVDDKGNVTTVAGSGNDVTGNYHSSEGLSGDSVWGTKGKWVTLTGREKGADITIGMIDHPLNPGYPTYWHARGYGLFALNPLGQKIFSKGAGEMNLTLQPGQAVTFRYRIIIHSGRPLSNKQMDNYAAAFARKEIH